MGSMFRDQPVQTETRTSLPDWVTRGAQDLFNRARDVSGREFERFSGNPYGGSSEDSRTAFQGLRDQVNSMTSGAGKAAFDDLYGRTPQKVSTEGTFDAGDIAKYMSPYVDKALQPAIDRIQQSADAARNRIRSGATAARAFGDARHGIADSQLDLNTSRAMGDTASQFMMNAFNQAVGTKQADINRNLDVARTNASLDQQDFSNKAGILNQQNSALLGNLDRLLGAGQYQDTRGTQAGTFDFNEFLRGQGFDQAQMGWLGQLLAGLPMDRTQTGTQSGGVGAGWGMLGGLLSGLGRAI